MIPFLTNLPFYVPHPLPWEIGLCAAVLAGVLTIIGSVVYLIR